MNALGALVVTFTLAVNLARGRPLASVLIAAALHRLSARAGRPRGIAGVVSQAEA